MGTATLMTRARAAAKNAFTEPPSTAVVCVCFIEQLETLFVPNFAFGT